MTRNFAQYFLDCIAKNGECLQEVFTRRGSAVYDIEGLKIPAI